MNNYNSVKRVNDKVRRTFKYWRVRYHQANDRERLHLFLFLFLVLTYTWLLVIVH